MASIDRSVLEQLRFATVANPSTIDLSIFPDFFLAGPQRTGSTWLYEVLGEHPQIFLSFAKEVFYWNVLKDPSHWQRKSSDLEWYLAHFHSPELDLAHFQLRAVVEQRRRLCREKFGIGYAPRVYGEATASYAAGMDDDMIREVVTLNPDIRIVIMIRHPIDRIWSHAKKDLGQTTRKRRLEDVPAAEFRAFFADPYNQECGFYSVQIERWSKWLRPGHLFVGLFDDITRRPIAYVTDVLRFLGVDTDPRYFEGLVGNTPNQTEPVRNVPEPFRSTLEQLYRDEIAILRERFHAPW